MCLLTVQALAKREVVKAFNRSGHSQSQVSALGHTYVEVRIYSLGLSAYEEVSLLVDSGSTYTWVQKDRLDKLGIKREDERGFRTIDNRVVRRPIGMGVVELMERRSPTVLVFAEKEDAEVLGVHALEGLGVELDPVTKQLKKTEAILAI